MESVFYGSAWAHDASVLFYTTVDDGLAPRQGVAARGRHPRRVETWWCMHEPDERFWIGIELTRSERFLLIESSSKITSEVWFLPADRPARRAGR